MRIGEVDMIRIYFRSLRANRGNIGPQDRVLAHHPIYVAPGCSGPNASDENASLHNMASSASLILRGIPLGIDRSARSISPGKNSELINKLKTALSLALWLGQEFGMLNIGFAYKGLSTLYTTVTTPYWLSETTAMNSYHSVTYMRLWRGYLSKTSKSI